MKIRTIILVLLTVTLSSCIDKILGHKYVATIENYQIGFEHCYSVKGLFDHFPKSISNKSYIYSEAGIPINKFDPESTYSGYTYLFLDMGKDSLLLYPKTYIYKTSYTNRNLIIDDSFSYYKYSDTLKLRNVDIRGAYPIPYFEDFDFSLGSKTIDLRSLGIHLMIEKYNVPEDLEVFVLKAGHGFFWKLKFEQKRPETLGEWKNGYSCGIAISKKRNMIVYWMKAW
jgi:hypothetical protein